LTRHSEKEKKILLCLQNQHAMRSTAFFSRTLGTAVGDFVHVCDLTSSDTTAAFGVHLSVVESSAIDRAYRVEVVPDADKNVWKRLVPVDRTESGTTWSVDALVGEGSITFRIIRTDAGRLAPTPLKCKVMGFARMGREIAITESTTTGTEAPSAIAAAPAVYDGALLTQVGGKVGINTDLPVATLDVRGSVLVSANVDVGGSLTVGGNSLASIAQTAVVSQTITNGVTTTAPSQDAVFDALALKLDAADIYTKTELDAGQLDTRYYTETEANSLLSAKANVANALFTGTTVMEDLSSGNVAVGGSLTLQGLDGYASFQHPTGNALYVDATTGAISKGPGLAVNYNSWTSHLSNNMGWVSVTWGGNTFVAVADGGIGHRVMTSPDGITWTSRTSAADTNQWRGVTYGNGLFVAVAISGVGDRVTTSPDGITWTTRQSAADYSWNSVTYGNGLFVAVASTGTGDRVMTSPDGITWTTRQSAADISWRSVTYGNGLFVAVAESGTGNRVMTSPDGITWTSRTSATDNNWRGVTYGNGLFVAVAWSGTGDRVMTSPDGITWTSRQSAADISWIGITLGDGLFVAVATTGTGNRVMTSPDGITWTSRQSATDNVWRSVTYGNGRFVAVSSSGTNNRVMSWKYPFNLELESADLKVDHLLVGGNSIANIAQNAVISQTITNGVTTSAPSQDAVFDALALKSDAADVYTKTQLDAGQLDNRYYTETEVNSLLAAKENTITSAATTTYFRGDKTFQTLNTTAVAEGASLYYTDARARTATVAQTITDGVTTSAPSQDAVFDALALKLDAADIYTKTELDAGQLDTRYYTETEVDAKVTEANLRAQLGLSSTYSRVFVRNLGNTLGNSVDICRLSIVEGAMVVRLDVVQNLSHNSFSRSYLFTTEWDTTAAWQRLCPLSSVGDREGNDWAVDVFLSPASGEGRVLLRLVRTGVGFGCNGSTITSSLSVSASGYTVNFEDMAATGSGATNTGIYRTSVITQVDGNVGINTDAPAHTLDVEGSARITGNLSLTGLGSQQTGNVVYIEPATGQLSFGEVAAGISAASYGTSSPYIYTGPGASLTNGVSFGNLESSSGASFVAASGNNSSIFTFSLGGTYMLQAEVDVGFPWLPEADVSTYYVKNGNASVKFGKEAHPVSGFACTSSYVMMVNANDDVRFVVDSVAGNEYEAGVDAARLTLVRLG
jgi:predicted RecA/RadA family phage recombinase